MRRNESQPTPSRRLGAQVAALALAPCLSASEIDLAWAAAGFEKVEQLTVDLPASDAELRLPLTALLARGSNWTASRVERQLVKTQDTFAACGVSLGPVTFIRARFPGGKHDLDMTDSEDAAPRDIRQLAEQIPAQERPLAIFVGQLLGDTAVARSYRRAPGISDEEASRHPYLATVWVSYKAHWIERPEQGYSPLAHELAHVLCDCGHTGGDQRHLLNDKRNRLGARALPEDCARIRQSPFIQHVRDR